MQICLYCKASTTGGESRAHVLPEGIVANDLLMPSGAICDRCNNYFGCLDTALASHPLLAFGIQALALPGKSGKPRAQLGWFQRVGDRASHEFQLPAAGIKQLSLKQGKLFVAIKPLSEQRRRRFHRALHYVGFNLMSLCAPPEELLGPAYDPVRRYVRQPRPMEIWPYCHSMLAPQPIDFVYLSLLKGPTPQVALFLFNHAFAVDLFRTGTLLQQLRSWAPNGITWSEVV